MGLLMLRPRATAALLLLCCCFWQWRIAEAVVCTSWPGETQWNEQRCVDQCNDVSQGCAGPCVYACINCQCNRKAAGEISAGGTTMTTTCALQPRKTTKTCKPYGPKVGKWSEAACNKKCTEKEQLIEGSAAASQCSPECSQRCTEACACNAYKRLHYVCETTTTTTGMCYASNVPGDNEPWSNLECFKYCNSVPTTKVCKQDCAKKCSFACYCNADKISPESALSGLAVEERTATKKPAEHGYYYYTYYAASAVPGKSYYYKYYAADSTTPSGLPANGSERIGIAHPLWFVMLLAACWSLRQTSRQLC